MTYTSFIKKLKALLDEVDDIVCDLEEKKTAIEDKAYDRESGENTEREQERIETLESQIEFLEDLQNMEVIE